MAAENQDITIFAATRHVIQITCVDSAGNVKDITGDVIEYKLLDYPGATTALLTLTSPSSQIDFVDPTNGRVDVILLPGDTDNDLIGLRAQEVQRDNTSGTAPEVVARGSVTVKYNAGAAGATDGVVVSVNSYVTRDQTSAYLRLSPRAQVWFDIEPDVQDRSIVGAFREIEKARYVGVRTGGDSQVTQFPRDGIVNNDDIDRSGDAPAPIEVQEAQMEYAFEMSQDPELEGKSSSGSNVKSVGAGSAKVAFFQPGRDASGNKGTRFPTIVQRLLGSFLAGTNIRVTATGTDGESSFTECDEFGLSEGFK